MNPGRAWINPNQGHVQRRATRAAVSERYSRLSRRRIAVHGNGSCAGGSDLYSPYGMQLIRIKRNALSFGHGEIIGNGGPAEKNSGQRACDRCSCATRPLSSPLRVVHVALTECNEGFLRAHVRRRCAIMHSVYAVGTKNLLR